MTKTKTTLVKRLFFSAQKGQKQLAALTPKQKSQLEKCWDVEHAYYSSALEGSKMDRREFDKLAATMR